MRNQRNNKILKMIIISRKLMRILTLFSIIISTISIKTILKYLQSIWSIVPEREKKIFMMQIQVEETLQGPGQTRWPGGAGRRLWHIAARAVPGYAASGACTLDGAGLRQAEW